MSALDLARWQFAITTVYHFLFVPLTLGLVWLVAGMQTAWVRTGNEKWLRATKFFGKIFLINFAMGVVTGIVQEFQFGMNWSDYSRFVGDIFGAPLAIEGLLAFFLESTFIGLWIFGWDRLPKKVHLATIWLAALGTMLSAYFILAANSWMQHPVGYELNPETGRAELTDFVAVLTNNTAVIAFVHTLSASFLVSGTLVAAISVYLLIKDKAADVARSAMKLGLVTTVVAAAFVTVSGHFDGHIMTQQQPMKMAAAEALYETAQPAPFSIFTVGTLDGSEPVFSIEIPKLLSFLATGSFDGKVEGINNLEAQYQQQYAGLGLDSFTPNIPLSYWSFRLMIGLGLIAALWALWALWAYRGDRRPKSRWALRTAIIMPLLPLVGISFGWIFTEIARQPWIVFGVMATRDGVSPIVGAGYVTATMIGYTLLYLVLAVVEVGLIIRTVRQGPPEVVADPFVDREADELLTISY
ncbi:MAG TPA: cytochrome ubiquinol oxidase subunit I [Candidatus Nanopelagicales bacterium]